jgi:hypothetical protein
MRTRTNAFSIGSVSPTVPVSVQKRRGFAIT